VQRQVDRDAPARAAQLLDRVPPQQAFVPMPWTNNATGPSPSSV